MRSSVRGRSILMGALAMALVVVGLGGSVPVTASVNPPNLFVIMLDDLDQATLRRMLTGEPGIRPNEFPNLAALAKRGAFARNGIVNTSLCCPSRATFLLGQYPSQHKIWSHGDGQFAEPDPGANPAPRGGGYREFLRRGHERQTIAVALDERYRTIAVGKYLNGYDADVIPSAKGQCRKGQARRSVPPGWDAWFGLVQTDADHIGYNGYQANIDGCLVGASSLKPDLFLNDSREWLLDQIDKAAKQPFFVYFAPPHPHLLPPNTTESVSWLRPKHRKKFVRATYFTECKGRLPKVDDANNVFDGTPADCADRYSFNEGSKPDGLADKPSWVRQGQVTISIAHIDQKFRQRLAAMRAFDDALGEIVRGLADRNKLDNIIIVLTSDNGFRNGEHGLRSGKSAPYEEETQVPLIFAGASVVPNYEFAPIVSSVDVHATLLDFAGIEHPSAGVSVRAQLEGASGEGRGYAFIEGVRGDVYDVPRAGGPLTRYRAIREPDRKFIWSQRIDSYGLPLPGTDFFELYELTSDPREMYGRQPTPQELVKYQAQIMRCISGQCPGA